MNEPITILSLVSFSDEHLDKLRAVSPQVEVHQHTAAHFDDLPPDLPPKVQILYGWGKYLAEAHRFPRLRWIQTHSAGVDALLDKPVWQSDVLITSMNGIHAVPMAEHALALMLAFRWNLRRMFNLQTRAEWPKDRWALFARPELRGSTLGIVGYGAIGRELARQADALGMRVLATNRTGERRFYQGYSVPGTGDPAARIPEQIYPTARLVEMLTRCDYVVVVAPLTPETRGLFGLKAFAAMKESAVFINLGRGKLVDEAALVEALQKGYIAGAGLDVFQTEPLPPDSPLWQMDNVIISPHVSGFTPLYDERASDLFAENLRRFLAGRPMINLVQRERGY
ncbi:MAG: D-2-hydroxyacid dehydrogenase [Chloroflexi bacterium]|nr:MAG: D-2-hydroxyacid dehydrogenase [Chloroflexota bacterium]